MTALRDTPARITLRNAALPEHPLVIDGPIAIVAELDGTQSSSPVEAQRVLVARALHQLISEQFPTSTLRFVVDDVPTFGGFDAAVSAERELQWISYCGRLSVPPPDPSLRTSLIREQRELALLEMIEAKTLVCVQRFGDYETFDVNRTRWVDRSAERMWALPATIPLYDNGRVGGRNPSGWAIWGSFTAVELCTIAVNDGLPIVLLSHTNNFVDPLAVSAIAELREFSQPIACIPVSVGTIANADNTTFIDSVLRECDPRIVRHWLLCGDSRRKHVARFFRNRWHADHFRLCSERATRVIELRTAAKTLLGAERPSEGAPVEALVELDQLHGQFVHCLRTEFNVEGASQVMVRTCKWIERRMRHGEYEGLREALSVLESMASIVGIA